jgi:hypothetical protein
MPVKKDAISRFIFQAIKWDNPYQLTLQNRQLTRFASVEGLCHGFPQPNPVKVV